jgi:hypothetical protein
MNMVLVFLLSHRAGKNEAAAKLNPHEAVKPSDRDRVTVASYWIPVSHHHVTRKEYHSFILAMLKTR